MTPPSLPPGQRIQPVTFARRMHCLGHDITIELLEGHAGLARLTCSDPVAATPQASYLLDADDLDRLLAALERVRLTVLHDVQAHHRTPPVELTRIIEEALARAPDRRSHP